jgi:hypothetical protein
MLNTIKLGILLLCCLLTAACVNNTGIREEFEKSVKDYNRLLRWHEVSTAGMLYMVPEEREAFTAAAEMINKKDLSITDFRILTMECLTEKGSGDAVVEFDYYILPSNRIKTLTYKQEWTYREISEKKIWKVKSALPVFK